MRVLALNLLLGVAATLPAQAADEYKIFGVQLFSSSDLIWVGKGWRKDLPKRIQATLHVNEETPSAKVFVKAYFFDQDDKVVGSYRAPCDIWAQTPHGYAAVGLPPTLSPTKTTTVYFAIPEDLTAKRWTTVLVVFGDAATVTAMSYPPMKLPQLDFPEKAKLPPAIPSIGTIH